MIFVTVIPKGGLASTSTANIEKTKGAFGGAKGAI